MITKNQKADCADSANNVQELIHVIQEEKKYCFSIIKQYVPVQREPKVHIVVGEPDLKFSDGKRYPTWVKALSIRDNVYLLVDRGIWTRSITINTLIHELLHSAIWIYYGTSKYIPVWFNEALAHWITKVENIRDSHYPDKSEDKQKKDITNVHGEQWFDNSRVNAQIEVMVSYLLSSNTQSKDIHNLLRSVKEGEKFTSAARRILNLNIVQNMTVS
ncbi:MAG: hypothetical protein AB2535_03865 [Candidatus Thiodiazotropha endolucinida]